MNKSNVIGVAPLADSDNARRANTRANRLHDRASDQRASRWPAASPSRDVHDPSLAPRAPTAGYVVRPDLTTAVCKRSWHRGCNSRDAGDTMQDITPDRLADVHGGLGTGQIKTALFLAKNAFDAGRKFGPKSSYFWDGAQDVRSAIEHGAHINLDKVRPLLGGRSLNEIVDVFRGVR
jgi:hypothetical protein